MWARLGRAPTLCVSPRGTSPAGLPRQVLFTQFLHRLVAADKLPAPGLRHRDLVAADITTILLTRLFYCHFAFPAL